MDPCRYHRVRWTGVRRSIARVWAQSCEGSTPAAWRGGAVVHSPAMGFAGWPAEAIEFYEGLEADNSKTYWMAHKSVYEEAVRRPMAALLDELAAEFGEGGSSVPTGTSASAGQGPLQDGHRRHARRRRLRPAVRRRARSGTGMYMMAPDQLERYRRAVADDASGGQLESAIAQVEKKEISVSGHERLKTAPRGYPKDHPRIDLLCNKGLITWQQWDVGPWLGTNEVKTRVARFLRASRPVCDWLDVNVGPTAMELRH